MPVTAKGFKIPSTIDLDALILSTINTLCDPVVDGTFETDLQKLQKKVKNVEKKQKEINKIFTDCHNQLDAFKNDLESNEQKDEDELLAAQKAVFEASKQPSEITIVDSDGPPDDENDDDDDVQFIEKTFDPDLAFKRQQQQMMRKSPGRAPEAGSQPNQSLTGQSRANLTAALSAAAENQRDQQLKQQLSSPPGTPSTIASARAMFTAMVGAVLNMD